MRVLIDTNLLFSALYRNGSVPRQAYNKAVELPHQGLICERSLDELRDSFIKKFPDRANELDLFIISPTYASLRGGGLAEGKSGLRPPPL